jgi:hypothetical protein
MDQDSTAHAIGIAAASLVVIILIWYGSFLVKFRQAEDERRGCHYERQRVERVRVVYNILGVPEHVWVVEDRKVRVCKK